MKLTYRVVRTSFVYSTNFGSPRNNVMLAGVCEESTVLAHAVDNLLRFGPTCEVQIRPYMSEQLLARYTHDDLEPGTAQ